jgi:transposase
VWVQILLSKYLYAQPMNRLLQSWAHIGLNLSQGTIIGGLKRLAPLFIPVVQAMQARQLTDGACHADETGWKVFESIEGKVGYKWFLWVIRSTSAIVYVMAPGRGAKVPLQYFSKLLVQTIVVCDRYSAYKKFARIMGVLLAFCWAHVRRDFLTLARSYPALEPWAMDWVERIGTLYHLNEMRLTVREEPGRFAEQDRVLRAHLQQMQSEAQVQRTDPSLRRAARKVLLSLQTHWEGLTVFVDRPDIAMDNNVAEAALRNEVMGRKAYYGSGSIWAADLAASLFTILMTLVHAWQINPQRWLQEYLQACADHGHRAPPDLSAFLPWTMSAQRLADLRRPCLTSPAAASRPIKIDTS